jgi:hypothetical protein
MPLHDWTRVDAGIFHAFHVAWIPELQRVLNGGLLPEGYYALAEQHAGRAMAIRHVSGHRLVALLEIVSPANKDRASHVEDFAAKAVSALDIGVHLLLVDLLPPGPHDPYSMNGVILRRLEQSDQSYELPVGETATLASYAAVEVVEIYIEHVALGAPVLDMALFLRPDRYVNVPLEPTYQAAYAGMPAFWRGMLEGKSSTL